MFSILPNRSGINKPQSTEASQGATLLALQPDIRLLAQDGQYNSVILSSVVCSPLESSVSFPLYAVSDDPRPVWVVLSKELEVRA